MRIYTASTRRPACARRRGIGWHVANLVFSRSRWIGGVRPILVGRTKAGKPRDLEGFDLAPYVKISMGSVRAACRDALRPDLALYIGGMGGAVEEFYNVFAVRLGYEEAAAKIQDLYLGGHKKVAEALVPDKLIDEISAGRDGGPDQGPVASLEAGGSGGKTGHAGADRRHGRGAAAWWRRRCCSARARGVIASLLRVLRTWPDIGRQSMAASARLCTRQRWAHDYRALILSRYLATADRARNAAHEVIE